MWFKNKDRSEPKQQPKKPIPYTNEGIGQAMRDAIQRKKDTEKRKAEEHQKYLDKIASEAKQVVLNVVLPNFITHEQYYFKTRSAGTYVDGTMLSEQWEFKVPFKAIAKIASQNDMSILDLFEKMIMINRHGFVFYVEARQFVNDPQILDLHIPCGQFMTKVRDD